MGRNVSHQAGIFERTYTTPKSTRRPLGLLLLFVIFDFGSWTNSAWHSQPNRRHPRKRLSCLRLLLRRDPSFPRGSPPGAAAARGPKAPSTGQTTRVVSNNYKPVANQILKYIFASQATRAPTWPRLRSDVSIAVYPSLLTTWRLRAAWGTQGVPKAMDA